MRNRAKCKLCESIIESFHKYDNVACKCGEISIEGGVESYLAYANDFKNFLRIDDEGNEILVNFVEKTEETKKEKPTKKELIDMLEQHVKSMENLPENAMYAYVTQAELYSLSLLLLEIVRSEN